MMGRFDYLSDFAKGIAAIARSRAGLMFNVLSVVFGLSLIGVFQWLKGLDRLSLAVGFAAFVPFLVTLVSAAFVLYREERRKVKQSETTTSAGITETQIETAIKYLQSAKARVNDGKEIDVLPVFRRAAKQLAGVGLDQQAFSNLLSEMQKEGEMQKDVVWYKGTVEDIISEFKTAGVIRPLRQKPFTSGTPSGADLSVWELTDLGIEVRRKLESDSSDAD